MEIMKIYPPTNSGSFFYNYKNDLSIVLLGLIDSDCNFIYIDTSCNGRIFDGGVFAHITLYNALENNSLCVPADIPLPNRATPSPFVIIANNAFPLKNYILKLYWRSTL